MFMDVIPQRFWNDDRWAKEHYVELVERYPEKWVAVVNGEVVSVGDGPSDVREEARRKTGERHIAVMFIEGGLNLY